MMIARSNGPAAGATLVRAKADVLASSRRLDATAGHAVSEVDFDADELVGYHRRIVFPQAGDFVKAL